MNPFHEWTLARGVQLTPAQRHTLRHTFKAVVQPADVPDGFYDVRPESTIGAANVDGATMIVRPKITIDRIMFLLGYTADPQVWQDGDTDLAGKPDLVTAMATVYARLATRALERGLLAGYRAAAGDLYAVRGRVDLATQLRRRPGLELPLAAIWQEYDEDVVENQLLLAAARLFRHLPIAAPTTRRMLHGISVACGTSRPSIFGRRPCRKSSGLGSMRTIGPPSNSHACSCG